MVPVYNGEQYISDAVESVLNQTLSDIELICVDDCSDDRTYEILQEYAAKDERVKVIRLTERSSTPVARKRGVLAASGEYIMFGDADDFYSTDACEYLYQKITELQTDILHFSAKVLDFAHNANSVAFIERLVLPYCGRLESENVIVGCFRDRLYGFNLWNKIYRTDLCKKAISHVKDEFIINAEDAYIFFLIASFASSYVGMETPCFYHYRYGLGGWGRSIIDRQEFQYRCHSALVVRNIREFISENENSAIYQECVEALSQRLLATDISLWRNNIPSEN